MEYSLVATWLRKDPGCLLESALAGSFSAISSAMVASLIAQQAGYPPAFPLKLLGTIIAGPQNTDYDTGCMALGIYLWLGLCIFSTTVFAHFVATRRFQSLFLMGLVWGTFSWIFLWNLFMQSFPAIYNAHIPSASVFCIWMVFGMSLTSLALFARCSKD